MRYDFNILENRIQELKEEGRIRDALRIYFFMADGDLSLDAGYLGLKIAECYEALGEPYAAKYWYGRAVEEGAGAWRDASEARDRLEHTVTIDDLIPREKYIVGGS